MSQVSTKRRETQPITAEPWLAIWFDELGGSAEQRNPVYKSFAQDLQRVCKFEPPAWLLNFTEDMFDSEVDKFEELEDALIAAGWVVYNSDNFFEVYKASELGPDDMEEDNSGEEHF